MRFLAVIALLMLSACSTVPENAAVVQSAQVRAALENRHLAEWVISADGVRPAGDA